MDDRLLSFDDRWSLRCHCILFLIFPPFFPPSLPPSQADRRFLSELQALLRLGTLLPSTPSSPSSSPDLILFAADGLRTLQLTYGPSSPPSSLAKKMIDVALAKTSRTLGEKYEEEGGVISQVLLRQTVRKGGGGGGELEGMGMECSLFITDKMRHHNYMNK